jgi:hypothetical protein
MVIMEQLKSYNTSAQPEILKKYKTNRFSIPPNDFLNGVSHDDYWFPEKISIWYFLESYHKLGEPVRRRYNQIYALAVNEIFSIFEKELLVPILTRQVQVNQKDLLYARALNWFCEEEDKHAEMFRRLNQAAEPSFYQNTPGRSYFLSQQANPLGYALVQLIRTYPEWLSVWIWISVYFEERTLIYSKYYLRKDQQHLSPVFREVHKLHMLEELYHVELDEVIIDRFYKPRNLINKKLATWIFDLVLQSYSAPRRMSQAIAKILFGEFPDSQEQIQACLNELPLLKNNSQYQKQYLGESAAPRTWRLMRMQPEMQRLIKKYR